MSRRHIVLCHSPPVLVQNYNSLPILDVEFGSAPVGRERCRHIDGRCVVSSRPINEEMNSVVLGLEPARRNRRQRFEPMDSLSVVKVLTAYSKSYTIYIRLLHVVLLVRN